MIALLESFSIRTASIQNRFFAFFTRAYQIQEATDRNEPQSFQAATSQDRENRQSDRDRNAYHCHSHYTFPFQSIKWEPVMDPAGNHQETFNSVSTTKRQAGEDPIIRPSDR
ncbi:hypothetical protein Mpal_0616 [Methanosphaerula palustris E1-9c]|uniref:Uncharacterized protein n=1 Tax=Methanosphaerula palustris (strain ATCC BAA-1556 / DSM 19958 / E1-9c) TaxID=521011 RepID=B8GFD9_METPE|nr:hypothetical protein Mpal_0616 [Methanosphaerula palustris E1-9c]